MKFDISIEVHFNEEQMKLITKAINETYVFRAKKPQSQKKVPA